ncbi:hypothetical protein N5D52_10280 [Pseudomonas sp. GD03860]|uniref:hypothetical protein n=1 Tax=Pseudomonas TaxID=286 RepID=UPI0023643A27|nr:MULTISPECIES: hypothetical protein [Pseudomonas]MDD2056299.1 hypothetical protein [Pseudomonas putida]MDH0637330.1 hypothetical protein [Pseudomonas sp. GD03860]
MQQQHYILALAALWLFTLAFLPFLFRTTRQRAYNSGYSAGLIEMQRLSRGHTTALSNDITHLAKEREAEQKRFAQIKAALKATNAELEARILSYTGLAVTKSDYEQLTKAAETLQMAQRTWEAAKGTEPWCVRAHNGRLSIQSLARRIHSQLRNTPAGTSKTGEAA